MDFIVFEIYPIKKFKKIKVMGKLGMTKFQVDF